MSELIQILNLSIIFCLSVPISHFSSDFLLQYWGNIRDLGYIYLMFGNAPITGLGSQPATTLTRGSNFKVGAVNANPRPRPITPKTIRPYLLKTPPWKSLFFRFGTFTIQHSCALIYVVCNRELLNNMMLDRFKAYSTGIQLPQLHLFI